MTVSQKLSPMGRALLVTVTYPLPTLAVICLSKLMPNLPDTLLSWLICLLGTLMILAYLKFLDKKPLSVLRLGVTRGAVKGFALSLGITTGLVCLAYALSMWFGQVIYDSEEPMTFASLSSAIMASFVLQGFPEELAFRAYLGQTLAKSPKVTMWWSAGLFSSIHLVHIAMHGWLWGLQTVFYAFTFGLFAFLLQELFQTTWAAVAVHGGLHVTRFIWEFKGVFPDYDYFYSGLLMLVASAYLIYRYRSVFDV